MTCAALAFAAGAAVLQLQAALPAAGWGWLLLAFPALLFTRRPLAWIPFAFAAGFLWASTCAHWRMADRLAPELEGRDIEVVGVVSSLPFASERGVRFEFEVESAPAAAQGLPRTILLSWYRSPFAEEGPAVMERTVHPGERWLFTVRLRRPHGLVNPHGFDYEAWLLERGIGATGYVRQQGAQRMMGYRNAFFDLVESLRETVRDRFARRLGATPAAGILAALAVGDQRAIAPEEWRLFSRTGVTHLMSISGLHVTLVSGLVAWLVSALWRRVPHLALRVPARKAGAAAAVAGALGYSLLAGFAVPAQRTFWMVAVVAAALWAGRIANPWRTLALALAVIVALDPWAPLAPGLWLSFGAVLLIFYVGGGWTRAEPVGFPRLLLAWGRVQWAITVGLAPAVLFLFREVSVAGPLANAVAIPLVSAVITPLALLAAVLPLDPLLALAAWLVEALLQVLEWCAALPGALWRHHAPAPWTVALALGGVAWLLAPRGVPWRACGLALLAPALALPPPAPRPGEAWITTFDAGQGLAVLVRTAGRALLYDAGPAFGPEADSGMRVVVPALQGAGVRRLDLFVVTHEDLDHLGGALSVMESLEVASLASSLGPDHPLLALSPAARRCAAGEAWEWDGVRFEFLHPGRHDAGSGRGPPRRNDLSCVLRVAARGGAMLLTGDIERRAEAEVAGRGARADLLLVPHHGSRTSSSPEFLAAVSPRWAIVPAGYRNRFGHPHPEVLARYRAAGVEVLRTDLHGAVTAILSSDVSFRTERAARRRYWLQ